MMEIDRKTAKSLDHLARELVIKRFSPEAYAREVEWLDEEERAQLRGTR